MITAMILAGGLVEVSEVQWWAMKLEDGNFGATFCSPRDYVATMEALIERFQESKEERTRKYGPM